MKEFEPNGQVRDDKAPAAEYRQVRAEKQLIGQMRPHAGHKVWEFDLTTGQIEEPKYERVMAKVEQVPIMTRSRKRINQTTVHKKVIQRDNCLYCSALNKKNAIKKFIPMYARLVEQGIIARIVEPNEQENGNDSNGNL